jgi:hypothetical protein
VTGTLVFQPGLRLQLELDGRFRRDDFWGSLFGAFAAAADKELDSLTILGYTDTSDEITLMHCFALERGTRTRYLVNLALLGSHYPSTDSIRFDAFSAQYTSLEEWEGFQPFGMGASVDQDARPVTTITYTDPPTVNVPLPRHGFELSVQSTPTTTVQRLSFASLNHECSLRVVAQQPMTWPVFRRRQGDVDHLIMVLAGMPVRVRRVWAEPPLQRFLVSIGSWTARRR